VTAKMLPHTIPAVPAILQLKAQIAQSIFFFFNLLPVGRRSWRAERTLLQLLLHSLPPNVTSVLVGLPSRLAFKRRLKPFLLRRNFRSWF